MTAPGATLAAVARPRPLRPWILGTVCLLLVGFGMLAFARPERLFERHSIGCGFADVQVVGRVADTRGAPVVGVRVWVPGRRESVGEGVTDETGRFDVRVQTHYTVVTRPGHDPEESFGPDTVHVDGEDGATHVFEVDASAGNGRGARGIRWIDVGTLRVFVPEVAEPGGQK